jgi:glutathione S-transferase
MFLLEFRLDHHDALLDAEGEARASEVIAYVEGTIHGQGYARIFMPEKFEPQDIVHQTLGLGGTSVTDQGWQIVEEGFAILDPQHARRPYAAGDGFGIADAALFYAERWASGVTLINVQRHYERMLARSAVHKVRQLWGEE